MFHGFRDLLHELGLTQATIAVEKNFFDAALYEVFAAHILPQARIVPASPIVSQLRMFKDPAEIECLKGAGRIADEGMAAAARALRSGVREIDIAGEAELAMRRAGAEGWSSATYLRIGMALGHGARAGLAKDHHRWRRGSDALRADCEWLHRGPVPHLSRRTCSGGRGESVASICRGTGERHCLSEARNVSMTLRHRSS